MGKGRVEQFSDGVFTIAATLLVLAVPIPHVPNGALLHTLLDQWPSYLAYLISFIVIGNLWISHHELFKVLRGLDLPLMYANLALLLFIAFLPFPTGVLAGAIGQDQNLSIATAMYALVMTGMSVTFAVLWSLSQRRGLLHRQEVPGSRLMYLVRQYLGLGIWLVSIGLAFFNPYLCLSLWLGTLVFYLVATPGGVAAAEER